MFSPPQLRMIAILGLILSAQASAPIFVRQNSASSSGTGFGAPSPASTPQTSADGPTTSPAPSTTPRESNTPTTRPPTTPITTPSTTPPSTSNGQGTTSPSRTSDDGKPTTPSSTPPPTTSPTKNTSKTPSPTSIDTAKITPSVVVVTQVQTVGGSTIAMVSSSTDSAGFTSAIAAASSSNAALASSTSQNSGSGGMSPKTRNTIIGVVVGIGGAAIFAGLFIVAWRIWGRKKHQPEEGDELMGTGFGSAPGEKPVAGTPAVNPFQSTLETYHNPARGNVNASSNF